MKIFFIFILMTTFGAWILNHSFINTKKDIITINPVVPTLTPTPTSPVEIQLLSATYGPPLGFDPVEFTIKAGIPARLEVKATENGRGCMGSITIPGLNDDVQGFVKGQTNIFDFTAPAPGEYIIACAMGIPQATIIVK